MSHGSNHQPSFFSPVKPQKLVINGDQDGLDEGTTGKLTCNVTSAKPKPMLSWMKEGMCPPTRHSLLTPYVQHSLFLIGVDNTSTQLNC